MVQVAGFTKLSVVIRTNEGGTGSPARQSISAVALLAVAPFTAPVARIESRNADRWVLKENILGNHDQMVCLYPK
jgi:hypothetical protein